MSDFLSNIGNKIGDLVGKVPQNIAEFGADAADRLKDEMGGSVFNFGADTAEHFKEEGATGVLNFGAEAAERFKEENGMGVSNFATGAADKALDFATGVIDAIKGEDEANASGVITGAADEILDIGTDTAIEAEKDNWTPDDFKPGIYDPSKPGDSEFLDEMKEKLEEYDRRKNDDLHTGLDGGKDAMTILETKEAQKRVNELLERNK